MELGQPASWFEKTESGLNAHAVDFARGKYGQLIDGAPAGDPARRLDESTSAEGALPYQGEAGA